ncbi:MAG: agmatine deiminase family protein [Clostridium sp.]
MKKAIIKVLTISLLLTGGTMVSATNYNKETDSKSYYMPLEDSEHEGTWLQWPHAYTYGEKYKKDIQDIWVKMTKSLTKGEKVHIVAYNNTEKEKIKSLLVAEDVHMNNVDFYIYKTDDVWIRDNGPVFVYDESGKQVILDWGFNGWGKKTPYKKCDDIPEKIGNELGVERINLENVVLEGGAMELDGNGTFLATKSSIINKNRNPGLSQSEIENYIKKYYGANNFIWLDGVVGIDITDFHIDGFAKFYDECTLITLNKNDLREWGVSRKDTNTLLNAKDSEGHAYDKVYIPITKNNVKLKNGKNLGYPGSYMNFYIGNEVVLVPNYNDPNDKVANEIIQGLYPDREVVGIDIRELYKDGGMIHCVTQQQPIANKSNN